MPNFGGFPAIPTIGLKDNFTTYTNVQFFLSIDNCPLISSCENGKLSINNPYREIESYGGALIRVPDNISEYKLEFTILDSIVLDEQSGFNLFNNYNYEAGTEKIITLKFSVYGSTIAPITLWGNLYKVNFSSSRFDFKFIGRPSPLTLNKTDELQLEEVSKEVPPMEEDSGISESPSAEITESPDIIDVIYLPENNLPNIQKDFELNRIIKPIGQKPGQPKPKRHITFY